MAVKYRLLRERRIHNELFATEGQTVYACAHYDYGCASDDTRVFGIEHISVTLDEGGGYPFFTIPVADLKKLEE